MERFNYSVGAIKIRLHLENGEEANYIWKKIQILCKIIVIFYLPFEIK